MVTINTHKQPLSVSKDQCLWIKVAVWECVLMEKSRLQEKLGHHWDSGEVSSAQPPVLFHCLARLACVFGMCMWLNSGSTLVSQVRVSGTGGREITGELQGDKTTCGREEASDRPLFWGGMDAQEPPGRRPNVRQPVHTHWKTALSFIGICHLCVCVCACAFVCMCVCSNWADDSQQEESRTRQHRQGGSVFVGVFVWLCGCKK